ncbi:MAG: SAM-dependent methyltransferase, partial [Pseudomonadota bacterium]
MIEASAATIRQLKGVPALIKVAGFALLRAKTGQLTITLPDGRALFFNRDEVGPRAHLNIKDLDMIKRVAARGDIGFAESYADGQWTTDDLTAILAYFASNYEEAGRFAMGGAIAKLTNRLRHFFNRNTRDGARRNIVAHYDLG